MKTAPVSKQLWQSPSPFLRSQEPSGSHSLRLCAWTPGCWLHTKTPYRQGCGTADNSSIRRVTSSPEAGPFSTATDVNKHSLAFRGVAVSVTELVTKIVNCREKGPGQLRLFL